MAIHGDLTRHIQETFLPSLPEDRRETVAALYAQIRRLEDLRTRLQSMGIDEKNRREIDREIAEIALAVRDAYQWALRVGRA